MKVLNSGDNQPQVAVKPKPHYPAKPWFYGYTVLLRLAFYRLQPNHFLLQRRLKPLLEYNIYLSIHMSIHLDVYLMVYPIWCIYIIIAFSRFFFLYPFSDIENIDIQPFILERCFKLKINWKFSFNILDIHFWTFI